MIKLIYIVLLVVILVGVVYIATALDPNVFNFGGGTSNTPRRSAEYTKGELHKCVTLDLICVVNADGTVTSHTK